MFGVVGNRFYYINRLIALKYLTKQTKKEKFWAKNAEIAT